MFSKKCSNMTTAFCSMMYKTKLYLFSRTSDVFDTDICSASLVKDFFFIENDVFKTSD